MKLGIQLWSVRNEANNDFRGTVKALKAMGYDGVEIAGIDALSYGEIAKILNEENMEAVSAHISLDELENADRLTGLKSLGLKYVAFNGMGISQETLPWLKDNLTRLGKICRENGIYLLYHNHDYEFKMMEDIPALDRVYSAVDAEYLGAELDVCWVLYAGLDPAEYIKKYSDRCPLIHIKDYNGGKKEIDFSYKTVGTGVLDSNAVIASAAAANAQWLIVEQDNPADGLTPMDCCKASAEYILQKSCYAAISRAKRTECLYD